MGKAQNYRTLMYPVFMGEITFSADDAIIERARGVARSEGRT